MNHLAELPVLHSLVIMFISFLVLIGIAVKDKTPTLGTLLMIIVSMTALGGALLSLIYKSIQWAIA